MSFFPVATNAMGFSLGQTQFVGDDIDALKGDAQLGECFTRRSPDTVAPGGRHGAYIRVRNESGAALTAGYGVRFAANEFGTTISGYADLTHPYFAGWVPKQYTAGVPANGVFWLLVGGAGARHGDTINVDVPLFMDQLRNVFASFGPIDDFTGYVASAVWAFTKDGSGTAAIQDAANGVILLTTDTTDENEAILHTAGESFLFERYKPIVFGGRIKAQEVNTDDANIILGLVSGASTSAFTDAGGGPPASYSGCCFYKVDGGTVWQAEVSLAGTQETDTDCGTRSTSAYTDFFAVLYPTSATSMSYYMYIDGVLVHSGDFTYTSATEMKFMCGVHTGTGSAETLLVDRLFCRQLALL